MTGSPASPSVVLAGAVGGMAPLSLKLAPPLTDTDQPVDRGEMIPGNGILPKAYSLKCVSKKAATIRLESTTTKLHSDWLFLFVSPEAESWLGSLTLAIETTP